MIPQQSISQKETADAQGAFSVTTRPHLKVIEGGKENQWVRKITDSIIENSQKTRASIIKETEENQSLRALYDEVANETKVLSLSKFTDEERVAYKIIEAKTPIVFISEAMAESMGNLSRYLFDTIPNAHIVFENQDAEKRFKKANFCDTYNMKFYSLGAFVAPDSHRSTTPPNADVVICFGNPSSDVRDSFPNADFVVKKPNNTQSSLNFSVISQMRMKMKTATLTI